MTCAITCPDSTIYRWTLFATTTCPAISFLRSNVFWNCTLSACTFFRRHCREPNSQQNKCLSVEKLTKKRQQKPPKKKQLCYPNEWSPEQMFRLPKICWGDARAFCESVEHRMFKHGSSRVCMVAVWVGWRTHKNTTRVFRKTNFIAFLSISGNFQSGKKKMVEVRQRSCNFFDGW